MEEDDKIKELFRGFDPELPSESLFMSRLKRNMEGVELVKRQTEAARRRNRRAVTAAAIAGFAVGVIFTVLMPYLCELISGINISIPYLGIQTFVLEPYILLWPIAAIVASVTAYNTYEIAMAKGTK